MTKSPLVVPTTTTRELIVGVCIGAVVFGLIIYAVMNMGTGVTGNTLTGIITEKRFTPQPEEQVTIGKGGVHASHVDGEYVLEVRVGTRPYEVWVDKKTYEAKRAGEPFVFPRPTEGKRP